MGRKKAKSLGVYPASNGGRKKAKSLGRVSNLEEHVRADWWCRIFNSMYLKTDSDVCGNPEITRREVDMYLNMLDSSKDDWILDLACGQGRHSLELARRGFKHVNGIDRSHYLIRKARSDAKKEGISAAFREGDARKLPYATDTFDVVMLLGNSFGYFEDARDDMKILKEIFRVLKPQGRLLIDVSDGKYLKDNFKPFTWEWIDDKTFVCRERSLSADGEKLISREIITDVEKGIVADQFYAERLYTEQGLKKLLERMGYSEVRVSSQVATELENREAHDLGMMEMRTVFVSTVKKEWTQKSLRKTPKKKSTNVVVVFGDPRRQDKLKPSSVFDEDDLYTIDQLKSALSKLEGYSFKFIDNHTTLIEDLLKAKDKADYVFNLCDEGFNNEPTKELHVPALLEILGLPYTGSAPQCLAYCYDKSLVRGIAREMGIPVPKGYVVRPDESTFDIPLDFPVLVKPNFGDSSFGLTQKSVAYSGEEMINAINDIRSRFGYDKPILVEEFLTGDDLTCGIIGNPPDAYMALPLTKEDYSDVPPELPRICGYEAKWLPDSPYWKIKSVQANLPPETEAFIVECCVKLAERLECRDYCRMDWRLDSEGNPKLLEVNPNPGWCWDGHMAKMSKYAKVSYSEMLGEILRAAETRLGVRH